MKTRNLFGIVCGSVALAACGGGGGGGGAPASVVYTTPSFLVVNQPTPGLTADPDGVSNVVTLTLNPNGSITFDLPGYLNNPPDSVTIDASEIVSSGAGGDLEIFEFLSPTGNPDRPDFVELVIVKDDLDNDLVALARIDQLDATPFGYDTNVVVGDRVDRASIGTGSASYSGLFVGSLLFGGQVPNFDGDAFLDTEYDLIEGLSTVNADFGAGVNTVSVAFSNFSIANPNGPGRIPLGGSFDSSLLPIDAVTAQYGGNITGNLGANGFDYQFIGGLNGAFFGSVDPAGNPEATAGVFSMDATNAPTGNGEFIGNFYGVQ